MTGRPTPDALHRLLKLALDTGEAASLEEAERLFALYRLAIEIGPDAARSPTGQAALLTAVNTARRCFLGGVEVSGHLDVPLALPWRGCRTLRGAVVDLEGAIAAESPGGVPRIVLGEVPATSENDSFAVRITFDGWCGGVVPAGDYQRLAERFEFTPAGLLGGALAVSEAFQFVRGDNPEAGRRAVGLSLWKPEISWLDPAGVGAPVDLLPAKLWLIGLGHLGQAYLWALGSLPYADPGAVQLVLQDDDILVQANDSTSPLTWCRLLGRRKTRAMAEWCEDRGFRAMILERRFAANFRIAAEEPQVALCGVDNALARSALEDVGFVEVVEAGLGQGIREYLALQVHSLPGQRTARERWAHAADDRSLPDLSVLPAYRALAAAGLDRCGLTLLAGRTVGASFVGTVAAALATAELLRLANGAHRYETIDLTLRSPERRLALRRPPAPAPFNPGATRALRLGRVRSR